MTLSAMSGPLVISSPLGDQDQAPSPVFGNTMLLDPRTGYAGGGASGSSPVLGWGGDSYLTVWQAPSTLAANNIVNAQTPTVGTGLPFVTTSGAGITVGVAIAGKTCVAIDLVMTPIKYGYTGAVQCYDPRECVARNVRITSNGNDSTGTFTVRGFDIYSQPLTEVITGANAGIAAGKKAFKYIWSITPGGTIASTTVSVGTGDVYGLPLYSAQFPEVVIGWAGTTITAPTGYLAGDTTSPATGITGDVRGTYAVQSASNGTNTLMFNQLVYPWALQPVAGQPASTAYTGLFGVPNFAG